MSNLPALQQPSEEAKSGEYIAAGSQGLGDLSSEHTDERAAFEHYELAQRREAYYPPFSRVANVVVGGVSETCVRGRAQAMADAVRREVAAGVGGEAAGSGRAAAGGHAGVANPRGVADAAKG